jgi:hypothetical protein
MEKMKLTSGYTKVGLIIGMIFSLAMVPVLIFVATHQDFHFGMIVGILVWLVLFGIILNLVIFNADVRVEDNKVILKKLFSKEKSFNFSEISSVKAMMVKRTKYTTVKFQTEGKTEKFILINKIGLISVSNTDSEAVLRAISQK